MASSTTDRVTVRRARERLEDRTFDARDRAYAELFEGDDAVLTEEELRLFDGIDPDLTRRSGSDLWGADEYEIVEELYSESRGYGSSAPTIRRSRTRGSGAKRA